MGGIYSFLSDDPYLYNMEALEDCELLLINKLSWDQLLEKIPALERYSAYWCKTTL